MFDVALFELDAERRAIAHSPAPAAPAVSRAKRAMDLSAALALLLMLSPILVLIAVLIRANSPGPVLFRQRRGGFLGQSFTVYKFRTMRVMEDGADVRQATRNDSRVTALGAFLRRTSLDELPQLINVVRGEMSLVGPRPHAVAHDREFQQRMPSYHQRFRCRPGITGLAQVRGFRGETGSDDTLEARVSADLEYIRTWSFWSDVGLLLKTLKVPLDRRAY